jgi:hypothetical protein
MARIHLRLYGLNGYGAKLTVAGAELAAALRKRHRDSLPEPRPVVEEIQLVEAPPESEPIMVYDTDDKGQMDFFSRLQMG